MAPTLKMLPLAAALALCTPASWALDLIGAYRQALERDAQYQTAQAVALASREALPQARAGLLPSVGLSAQITNNDTVQTSLTTHAAQAYDYTAYNYSLTLKQALFRPASVIQVDQAQAQVDAAEATLSNELQQLAVRVAGTYFDVLSAVETRATQQAQVDAFAGQLELAQKYLQAGRGTRTDVEEAQAKRDLAQAQLIQARNGVFVAERAFAAVYGHKISASELARLNPQQLRLDVVEPDSLPQWLADANDRNPELQSLKRTLDIAELDIRKQQAGHLPTLDAVVSRTLSSSETNSTVGTQYRTFSAGVQLYVPLFSGGAQSSLVRQAVANRERHTQNLEAARRQLEVNVAKEFSATVEGAARVRALEQATQSAQLAVVATEKGWQAGTRHRVDILNAQQQWFATQLELVRARHAFVMAQLKLKAVAGQLGESDLQLISQAMAPSVH